MKPYQASKIHRNRVKLVRKTRLSLEFLETFRETEIFHAGDIQPILECRHPEGIRVFYTRLTKSEAPNAYFLLLAALRKTNQIDILDLLNDGYGSGYESDLADDDGTNVSRPIHDEDEYSRKRTRQTLRARSSFFTEADGKKKYNLIKRIMAQNFLDMQLPDFRYGLHYILAFSLDKSDDEIMERKSLIVRILKLDDTLMQEKMRSVNLKPLDMYGIHLDLIKFLIQPGTKHVMPIDVTSAANSSSNYLSSDEFHELIIYLFETDQTEVLTKKSDFQVTILLNAVKNLELNMETVNLLMLLGLSLNDKDENGWNALAYAIIGGRSAEFITMLIELGAVWNTKEKFGNTALHLAAMYGNLEAVRLFAVNGADVNAQNYEGETPLILALGYGNKEYIHEVVEILVTEYGADVDIKDFNDHPAIWYAQKGPNKENIMEKTTELLRLKKSRPKPKKLRRRFR